jgi:uncharacterized membrane protein
VVKEEPNRSLLWPVVLVGIGVAGSVDEVVLHQLLRWHHLYDRGSTSCSGSTRAGPARQQPPYDLVYVAVAAVMLLAGLLLLRGDWFAEIRVRKDRS